MLVHWKEREPVYRAREQRIRGELGYVPAYATALAGEPVDVAPKERGRRGALTAPADPSQGVSRAEFEEMVADLGVRAEEPAAAARAAARPAGGPPRPFARQRRARAPARRRSDGGRPRDGDRRTEEAPRTGAREAAMPPATPEAARRNRRHGRTR